MPILLLPNAFGDGPGNMAIDSALLKSLPPQTALFRHYAWSAPTATFGYTQRYREVAAAMPEGLQLCRRPTGGGIVDHRNDWTYALLLAADLPAARKPATELYSDLHTTIARTLAGQDIAAELAPCPRHCVDSAHGESTPGGRSSAENGPDQCFLRPVANDCLTPAGTKIAGAAMKRVRSGLLLQGSLERAALPPSIDWPAFLSHFFENLAQDLDLAVEKSKDLRPLFDGGRIREERARFETEAWNQRR